MNLYELIVKRRSIRRFKTEIISYPKLRNMVNAGRLAPSAANLQPLEFIIVDDEQLVERVFGTLRWGGYIAPAGNPPEGEQPVAYIVVLVNNLIASQRPASINKDIGAACENIILAALSEGIGSCWVESIDRKALAEILGLPDSVDINSVIALGYPNEDPVTYDLAQPDDPIKYWKDEYGTLHVPKRKLEDILFYNGYDTAEAEESNWVTAWETTREEEAHLVKGFLEENDIPCVMESNLFQQIPVDFDLMGKIKLLVPEDKLEEAMQLIKESDNLKE